MTNAGVSGARGLHMHPIGNDGIKSARNRGTFVATTGVLPGGVLPGVLPGAHAGRIWSFWHGERARETHRARSRAAREGGHGHLAEVWVCVDLLHGFRLRHRAVARAAAGSQWETAVEHTLLLSLLFPGSDPCSLLSENPETSLGNGHPVLRRDLWDLTRVLKPTPLTHVQVEDIFARGPHENETPAARFRIDFPPNLSKQECWNRRASLASPAPCIRLPSIRRRSHGLSTQLAR